MTSESAASPRAAVSSPSCWQCGDGARDGLFCRSCGALQPFPAGTDYFAALGVERCPAIERATLDQRYYERSRQLHPDRYQNSPPQEQAASAENSALVNRAYRTLRDPVERGRYWLQLLGIGSDARQTTVPAALVAIVFEVQEQLEQVRAADVAQRAAPAPELAATKRRIERIHAGEVERLVQNLTAWRDPRRDDLALGASLSRILADVAYVGALLRDIDKALDG